MSSYERIKTGLLIGLVCLSMLLTWQLWTYQPDIALLEESTKYIPNEAMSEEKKLGDVIWPEQIIIHKEGKYASVPPDHIRFIQSYETLLTTTLHEEGMKEIEAVSGHTKHDGVEIIFPTSIPSDVFLDLFQVDQEEFEFPLTEIDRLYLYVETLDEQVHLRLFSGRDKKVIDLETSLSPKEFERAYVSTFSDSTEMVKLEGNPYILDYSGAVYLPKDPVEAKKLSFTVSPISGEFFRQSLFTDPDSVKYYRQSDNEESYTDGNRIINVHSNGLFMEYNNPVFSDTRDRSSKHIVHRSYEFINGHGGWTDAYFLTDWESSDLRDVAEYQLHINHYPVISFEGIDQMNLRVSRSGNQTESYMRPLFYLDSQPIDVQENIKLPAGQEVVDQLRKDESFDPDQLKKVIIGYEMTMPSRSIVTVEPKWFVHYDGHWQKVVFENEGGSTDGLE